MPHSHGHVCESESTHHDHDHDHDPPPEETNEVHSLYQYIRTDAVRTLNATDPSAGSRIIKPWTERWNTHPSLTSLSDPDAADSDDEDDESAQVIIIVPFDGQIKLKSILLRCPATKSAPKLMQVYSQAEDLDFAAVADGRKPVETFECVPYESAGDVIEYPVKQRLYNNITSLGIMISENWSGSGERTGTEIWYLGFRGERKELAQAPVAISYEAFANPKDHRVKGTEEMAGGLGL